MRIIPIAVGLAADVIAQTREPLLRRKLQAYHLMGGDVDDHRLDHEHLCISRHGVFPLLEPRVSQLRTHELHICHVALVLLISGDLGRVRRPIEHRPVGVQPARVVSGVTEILAAIGGELGLLAGGRIAHPQVPVANEGLRACR